MQQVTEVIGNPITIVLEKLFWLGLGGFFVLAILTSFLRGLKENKTNTVSPAQLENLAKKAIQQNGDVN